MIHLVAGLSFRLILPSVHPGIGLLSFLISIAGLLKCSIRFKHSGNPTFKQSTYFTLLTSLKIGVMIEIAMKPTTTPRKMISIGSIMEVRPFTVASTSWS